MSVLYKILQKEKKPTDLERNFTRRETPYETMYVRSIEKKAPKKSYKLRAILIAVLLGGGYIAVENIFKNSQTPSTYSPASLPRQAQENASETVDLFKPLNTSKQNTSPAQMVPSQPIDASPKRSSVEPNLLEPSKKELLKTAEKAVGDGHIKEAFFLYIKALKHDPQDTEIVNTLLNIAFSSEKSYTPWLTFLAQHFPQNTYIHAEIADRFSRVKDFQSATVWMEKALKIDPKNLTLHQNKAVYHDHLSQWQQASIHYQQVLTLIDQGNKIDPGINRDQVESRLNYLLSKTG